MSIEKAWTESGEGIRSSGDTFKRKMDSLRLKLFRHGTKSKSHEACSKLLETRNKKVFEKAVTKMNIEHHSSTVKIFRTVYYLAKTNRTFLDHPNLCMLQGLNGVDLGVTLHSRYSATGIMNSISESMRAKLCAHVINQKLKVSVLLDESTTVAHKSAVVIYVRTSMFDMHTCKDGGAFSFPLCLKELDGLDAKTITTVLLDSLSSNGFDNEYLSKHLIGACSDGASTMLGNKSGVLTRLKSKYPNIILWHCMAHRLELAVGDSVDKLGPVNHMRVLLDKLYTLYSTSPAKQRELETCAGDLCEVLKIGRVLGTRWCASSRKALNAIWQSYPALATHFERNKASATYAGLHKILTSKTFVMNLSLMLDAFSEIGTLSLVFQNDQTNLSVAFSHTKRCIRALKKLKSKELGEKLQLAEQSIELKVHMGIDLTDNPKVVRINHNQFYQALVDNIESRMEVDSAMTDFLDMVDVLDPLKWPTAVESPWPEGEKRIKMLADKFRFDGVGQVTNAFRDYLDNQNHCPILIKQLKSIVHTLPVSTADCERGFSAMNNIATKLRNRLLVDNVSNLMFISLVGPPLSQFQPEKYVADWVKTHRNADDTRSKRATEDLSTVRYKELWGIF